MSWASWPAESGVADKVRRLADRVAAVRVAAEPLAVERHDEEIGGLQPAQHRLAFAALEDVVAQRGAEAVEQAGLKQEAGYVRRLLGDVLGTDRTRRAGPVLDHRRLSPFFAQLVRDQPGRVVVSASGRIGHDDRDRSRGPGLRAGGAKGSSPRASLIAKEPAKSGARPRQYAAAMPVTMKPT